MKDTIQPAVTRQPWKYTGVSRSTWYNLKRLNKTPSPLSIGERCQAYLISDLDVWLESQRQHGQSV
jgi:predicted DNA-binding transcriptional regulator AlpA